VRDFYLDSWGFCLPRAELQAAFALACHVGMICRTLTWHRLVSNLEGTYKEKYVGYVAAWLQEFLALVPNDPTP